MEPQEDWKRAKSRGEKGGEVRPQLLQAEDSLSRKITPTPPPFHCKRFWALRQAAALERTSQEPCVPAALLGRSSEALLCAHSPACCRAGEGTATQGTMTR